MPKRKEKARSDDEDSGSDVDLVDVDFEYFDPSEIDFIAFKRLLNQLFQGDAESFNVHELAELIISQPLLGTTIKTDGRESDPYAFLTVLNLNVHKDHPSIKALISYLLSKATSNPSAYQFLHSIIGPEAISSQKHVGLLLGERLINMPVQVIPPMYRMLADEIQWAIDDREPYKFENYLIVSRLYRLSPEEANLMGDVETAEPPSKKQKNKKFKQPSTPAAGGTFPYHSEDETLLKFASHHVDYNFSNQPPRDTPDAFGLDTAGRLMVIPANRLSELVSSLSESYPVPT